MLRYTNNWKASCVLLHNFLERYFAEIEAAVTQLPAYAENYVEEILTSERANLRIRLRFQSGCLLEINEAICRWNKFHRRKKWLQPTPPR